MTTRPRCRVGSAPILLLRVQHRAAERIGRLDEGCIVADEDPQVIPYLLYEDAGAALDWLAETFGFTVRARSQRQDGSVRHGELLLDRGGVVMVGSPGPGFLGPSARGGATQLIRVVAANLTGQRERMLARGAQASPIEPGAPGWLAFSVIDPEGHEWYFTERAEPSS
jgi:uncharacterized glyoxalase superfamily protein PhnB